MVQMAFRDLLHTYHKQVINVSPAYFCHLTVGNFDISPYVLQLLSMSYISDVPIPLLTVVSYITCLIYQVYPYPTDTELRLSKLSCLILHVLYFRCTPTPRTQSSVSVCDNTWRGTWRDGPRWPAHSINYTPAKWIFIIHDPAFLPPSLLLNMQPCQN